MLLRRSRLAQRYSRLSAEWQVRLALVSLLTGSNALGIAVVFVLAYYVVPLPPVAYDDQVRLENLVLGLITLAAVAPVGTVRAWHVLHPVVLMLRPGATPTEDLRRDVLSAPRRVFIAQATLWAVASAISLVYNLQFDPMFAVSVFLIVGLAGWSTSCLTYLLGERALRPVARRVLAEGIPSRRFIRSVADRTMFAWGLGTGTAVLGSLLVGVAALLDPARVSTRQLAITVVVLGLIALAVGALSSYVAAQASSEPIRNLRHAVSRVEEGDLEVHVPIYDATEIGLLQAGFNAMVDGLREREQLQDLFGRHVGEDVARRALEGGVRLGGEVRDITVLFVDIIGSTTLAEDRPPEEVVHLLNRFFDVVIDVVHEYDGWINKFEGDAALAVWGAPTERADRHSAALAAARVLGRRLAAEVPELAAGIGVSGGRAVAGNVGAAERYEYTVIGDPVNEAARLTDHAKEVPARVVANQALVEAARPDEAARWDELPAVTVRGRSTPTRVATPIGPPNSGLSA